MTDKSQKNLLLIFLSAASLLMLAANLRPLFPSNAALLPEISSSLGLSKAQAGYLTTLPVLCMGLFAPFAPKLGQKIGIERTLLVVLIMIAIGSTFRGYAGSYGLFVGTALAGAGIAMGNVLLPSLVKRDFAKHAALMTGLYTMSLVGGAALAAAITLPLAESFDNSWQKGLSVWGALGLFAIIVWLPVAIKAGTKGTKARSILPVKGLFKDRLAWSVTIFMGLQSALAYCVMGWMSPILRGRGLDGTEAGLITSVSIFIQVGASMVAPLIAVKFKNQKLIAVFLASIATLSLMGIVILPLSVVWPLAIIQGIGQGGLFSLCLMLIVLRSADSNVAAHLSSMSQTIGYILAAIGPFFVGVLYEWTGSFGAIAILFALLGIGSIVSGTYAGRNEFVKAEVIESNTK